MDFLCFHIKFSIENGVGKTHKQTTQYCSYQLNANASFCYFYIVWYL